MLHNSTGSLRHGSNIFDRAIDVGIMITQTLPDAQEPTNQMDANDMRTVDFLLDNYYTLPTNGTHIVLSKEEVKALQQEAKHLVDTFADTPELKKWSVSARHNNVERLIKNSVIT